MSALYRRAIKGAIPEPKEFSHMTYCEAVQIMRYAQKYEVSPTLTQAMALAQFSFPIERKLDVIHMIVMREASAGRQIHSLYYFREAFRKAESDYHKGSPPTKGSMMKVSDILGIRE